MKFNLYVDIIVLFTFVNPLLAQDDVQIGRSIDARSTNQSGLFDFSDPSSVNIKVQLWGYVKYPGTYIIPVKSTINELLSLAGGPKEDATLDDIRVIKANEDSSLVMLQYDYNDWVWEKELKPNSRFVRLQAGDVVVVPGEPRYFVREDVQFWVSLSLAIATLTVLIISITQ